MFLLGLLIGIGSTYLIQQLTGRGATNHDLIAEYYKIENLTSVSPYDIKSSLERGTADEYVLVDLRSFEEYEAEHITGAINVPNYLPEDATGEGGEARIVREFQRIQDENPGKDIITYCYSAACMASRKVGHTLAEHGIYTKHLNIGWYEWKYYWTIWNGEDGRQAEDFITVGAEPGEYEVGGPIDPCGEGEFGC